MTTELQTRPATEAAILRNLTAQVMPLYSQAQVHMQEAKRRLVATGISPARASDLLAAALRVAAKELGA